MRATYRCWLIRRPPHSTGCSVFAISSAAIIDVEPDLATRIYWSSPSADVAATAAQATSLASFISRRRACGEKNPSSVWAGECLGLG